MKMISLRFAAFALLSVVLEVAADSLECEKRWSGPSPDNDPIKCIADADRLDSELWIAIVLALPIIAFLILLIGFPIAFLGRPLCGICGSNRRRPASSCCCGGGQWDDASELSKVNAYPVPYVQRIRVSAFVLALVSIGGLVIITVGAQKLRKEYEFALSEIGGIINFLEDILVSVKFYATLPSGEIVPPLSPSAFESFENVTSSYRDFLEDFRSDYDPIVNNGHSGLVAVAVIPTILLFIGFSFSVFDIRRCIPYWTTLVYFVFTLLYTVISLLSFVMALSFFYICTEIDLHHERRPGLIQWWVVPTCYRDSAFAEFQRDIFDAQRENSVAACSNMREICSPGRLYNPLSPSSTFQCNITDTARQCTSIEAALPILTPITAKENVPSPVCNSSIPPDQCGFRECASACTDPEARHFSSETLRSLNYAERFINASEVIFPIMDCDVLVDIVLRPVGECKEIRDGFFLLGAGTGISYLLLIYGIVVTFIGQKVFVKVPKSDDQVAEMESSEREIQQRRRKQRAGREKDRY